MASHMDIKMAGSKQHVVLGLLLLVLSVGYTSGSVLSSSGMLAAQQGQENVTQDNVVQVQQECDEEGAYSTDDYCNFCYCLNGHLSCSKKICFTKSDNESQQNSTKDNEVPDDEDPDYPEDPDYQECVEGTRWTEECNICECSFGQKMCTTKTCLDGRECVHGSSWVDDCNTCECYEGEATCTDKKCLSDSAPTCTEGSIWTQDCNICFCVNGIASCSKKICPAEGDDTITQLPEMTFTKENNGSKMAGNSVMKGISFVTTKIIIPSELDFCIYMINGQQEYFPYIPKCYKAGKLACAYCEDEAFPKYNPRTCKCHKKSRFRG